MRTAYFFGFGFWASLEPRVDEIIKSKSKFIYIYLTHHLPAITELYFLGATVM